MHRPTLPLVSLLALVAGTASAQDMSFNRIASFPVAANGEAEETSAEIIDATGDGMTLVYSNSPAGVIGMIDIADPANPQPAGELDLGGEPTAVAVIDTAAFVGVNTSESYTAPSGRLAVIDLQTRVEAYSCDLGGQPDSVAAAPDGSFVAVAIENERDEDLDDGRVGQLPAGWLSIVPVDGGTPDCAGIVQVDLTGLADIAPEDPEPEFVDINAEGEIVLTLQENNWIVVVSPEGDILSSFSAGAVDLEGVDATEDDALSFTEGLAGVVREPDAVGWIDADHFATANEGDMDGGSRGWTIFAQDGTVVWDSGNTFEHALVEIGHYPEGRSENKGVEPESIEVATFGGVPMVFVGSERGSAVGVYDVTDPADPVLTQILPSGIGPEGYVAIPERNLLISANETDLGADGGARAHVLLFDYGQGAPSYPMLTSAGADELIGWGALSGLAAGEDGMLYAVNDSFYAGSPTLFAIDPSAEPARIVSATPVTLDGAAPEGIDMEGITSDGAGGFWIANEGHAENGRPQVIWHVGADGAIIETVDLPADLVAGATTNGLEGITLAEDGTLWMAVQRAWADDEDGTVKLLNYAPETGEWTAVAYPLEATETGWIGLSEIVAHDGALYLIERDNQIGAAARVKLITRVSLDGVTPAPLGGELPVVEKEIVRDLLPDLTATGGYAVDKVEGMAFSADGTAYVVTDNDGVDDSSGETLFFRLSL
ncbi:esterase-like activity of phytase family protein [Wenxinia saemankumensis]|uniref:Esterase-like activity of phytase n=1 Tax=Wenxinia saemankumensis TaxID=1447782 RepID=A0A1M6HUA5_9RHOB|nr:esterase-like activity of phytase family protein [Wenxinia saemankumensis]SHJ25819.1 Esterase-like activity of phytase [Wenxinia saemankumensis]